MLSIYTSKEKAEQLSALKIIPDIDARFDIILEEADNLDTIFSDPWSEKVLSSIEGMTQRKGGGWITAKFGDVKLSDISTGGKGLLLAINYNHEYIVNIDPLGYNCIDLLFEAAEDRDIEVVSTDVLRHMQNQMKAKVNGVTRCGMEITFSMGEEQWATWCETEDLI